MHLNKNDLNYIFKNMFAKISKVPNIVLAKYHFKSWPKLSNPPSFLFRLVHCHNSNQTYVFW